MFRVISEPPSYLCIGAPGFLEPRAVWPLPGPRLEMLKINILRPVWNYFMGRQLLKGKGYITFAWRVGALRKLSKRAQDFFSHVLLAKGYRTFARFAPSNERLQGKLPFKGPFWTFSGSGPGVGQKRQQKAHFEHFQPLAPEMPRMSLRRLFLSTSSPQPKKWPK